MNFPVFDLHCDTAYGLLHAGAGETLAKNRLHIDLNRGSALSGYAQCFACYTTSLPPFGERAEEIFQQQLSALLAQLEENKDCIRLAKSAADIEENRKNGLMSAILTIEGTAGIGFDVERLSQLYDTGFRISTLGWNEDNPLTGSHKTGGGLTPLGKAYVKRAQQLGICVDVSHISDAAFWDIMDITAAPVIATHSNSRSVCNVSRNLTDEMFLAICDTGGVAGINLYQDFLGGAATIDTVCDHIFHFLELDPLGTHIALGGDLDGCSPLAEGISGLQDYPQLAQRLLERGLPESITHKIYWQNAIGVMKNCCT